MDIEQIRENNLKALKFKNNDEIYKKINDLTQIDCKCSFSDIVTAKANINELEKNKILDAALSLKPWRKGPFNLFDIFIDSEWQSFIKFNLLKPYINLEGKVVCDIGCNNGYYMFRMLEHNPKQITGFDPSIRTYMQFLFLNNFIKSNIKYELLGIEHLPFYDVKFDTLFCLGVIYHRSDPIKMLKDLKQSLNKNGEVFLDTMYLDLDMEVALTPKNTYSKIPNIYFIPTIRALENWCERAKFKEFEILETATTNKNEQRKTSWIDGESLNNFLDANDNSKTIEGYPAPKRVYVRLKN